MSNITNYQLYRTNIKLSGQMKWDIVLKSGGNDKLLIDDFHLTPVSDNVPYNRYVQENLMNYSHLENIKSYYHQIEGSFYESYPDPILASNEPLIVDDDYDSKISKIKDQHDDTLECGLKRMSYSIYGNQFSYFCPIWISNYNSSSDKKLRFEITLSSKDMDGTTSMKDDSQGFTVSDTITNINTKIRSDISATVVQGYEYYLSISKLLKYFTYNTSSIPTIDGIDILSIYTDFENCWIDKYIQEDDNSIELNGWKCKSAEIQSYNDGNNDIDIVLCTVSKNIENVFTDDATTYTIIPTLICDPDNDIMCIQFSLQISSSTTVYNDQIIAYKELVFDISDSSYADYHNSFIQYFNDYMSQICKSEMNNDNLMNNVMNIDLHNITDFNKNNTSIRGIDVISGLIQSKYISKLANNLIGSERLLMDADSLIIDNFKINHMIAYQLFNFNFIFDIEELVPHNILQKMWGANITADVKVFYGNDTDGWDEFEFKDFHTNYINIPCKLSSSQYFGDPKQDINIFDLIHDNRNVNLLDKNKMTQNIIHWALDGNNDYIFNLYTGFGGYINTDKYPRNLYTYQDSIDIWTKSDDVTSAGFNWTSINKLSVGQLNAKIINIEKGTDNNYVELGNEWCGHIKFKNKMNTPIKFAVVTMTETNLATFKTNVMGLLSNCQLYTYDNSNIKDGVGGTGQKEFILYTPTNQNNVHMIIVDENYLKYFLFGNFLRLLKIFTSNDTFTGASQIWLKQIYNWMISYIDPEIYTLSLLGYKTASGPSQQCSELEHYVLNKNISYVIRYDGYIKPQFVDLNKNIFYTKNIVKKSDLSNSSFVTYNDAGFMKLYPSINYYPWTQHNIYFNDDNDRYPIRPVYLLHNHEYRFFGNTCMKILKSILSYNIKNAIVNNDKTIIYNGKEYINIDDLIKSYIISSFYNIDIATEDTLDQNNDLIDYIYSKYTYKLDWKYSNDTYDNMYDYNIILTLK